VSHRRVLEDQPPTGGIDDTFVLSVARKVDLRAEGKLLQSPISPLRICAFRSTDSHPSEPIASYIVQSLHVLGPFCLPNPCVLVALNKLYSVLQMMKVNSMFPKCTRLSVALFLAASVFCTAVIKADDTGADDDARAEAVIKQLGGRILRNDDGETILVAVSGRQVSDDDLGHIANLIWCKSRSTITKGSGDINPIPALWLNDVQMTDARLSHLKDLTFLRDLSLRFNPQITDLGLKQLAGLLHLEELEFIGSPISDDGLVYLKDMPELAWLRLRKTKITGAGLEHLKGLKRLYMLDLSFSAGVGDEGFEHLKKLRNLKRLYLNGTAVTNKGLAHVKDMPQLNDLGLWKTKITDDGLMHLKLLKNLTALVLSETAITDVGLPHLRNLTSLRHLDLQGTKITNDGLVNLRNLTDLENLFLYGTDISDNGLEHLSVLTNLELLSLSNTDITDEGLTHLSQLKRLVELKLKGTTLSKQAVDELQETLPDCKIEFP
jgi:Leucine-rich repeat (LRR) protein